MNSFWLIFSQIAEGKMMLQQVKNSGTILGKDFKISKDKARNKLSLEFIIIEACSGKGMSTYFLELMRCLFWGNN